MCGEITCKALQSNVGMLVLKVLVVAKELGEGLLQKQHPGLSMSCNRAGKDISQSSAAKEVAT